MAGRFAFTAGGTLFAIGAGTVLVSTVCMAGVRGALAVHRRKHAVSCSPCQGRGKLWCEACRGDGVMDWSPFEEPSVHRHCLCPSCNGSKDQTCLNCLGKGVVDSA
mmetsp:Transcript_6133/g.15827  ORF Transcript_6133/g.15827 Transcript_6133/m.15827 type:complete len:106 (-) Transcript_6133:267-584(-)|eukprot:jgi/Tetstr1/422405/TSEL_013243.t1